MDPITILAVVGICTGLSIIAATFRESNSSKAKMKRSKKKAIREANKASKEYKKSVEKTLKGHRF